MPFDPDAILKNNHRPAILDELDDFNTADVAGNGGILQGILAEQIQESQPAEPAEPKQPKSEPAPRQQDDLHYQSINTSMQEFARQQEQANEELRAQQAQLLQEQQQLRQWQAQQARAAQQPQVDPDMPVTYREFGAIAQSQQELRQYMHQQAWEVAHQRAQNAYLSYKVANPDFPLTLADFNKGYRKGVGNDLNKAASTDWYQVMETMHQKVAMPSLREENARLKKQVEELTKKTEAKPKVALTQPANALSPAVPSNGRAVASTHDEPNADVINMRSFRQRGNFKGFATDLRRAGHIK